jgi:hypothetical protein
MTENCKNCNENLSGNFCNQCGQKKFKRIDKKYIVDELQYTLLHANKGLLFSIKNIVKNPGKTAREYIDGNRVNHYKPLLLAFLLSGFSTFISFKILHIDKIMSAYNAEKHIEMKYNNELMSFISSYNSLVIIMLIPFFALATKIAFRKWGHNFYEHVVMNAYIMSYYTLISIILIYPFLFFIKNRSSVVFMTVSQFSILLLPILLFHFFKKFYADQSFKAILKKVLVTISLIFVGYILLVIIVGVGFVVYAITSGNADMIK